ncbi:Uncharacterized conserved protein, contains HEPN domain [Lachnospiraceae bacterium A10]|nr:Uncharacterized conserved protein, contains HEPN domain [Lachnospiraceae bacterium A10]
MDNVKSDKYFIEKIKKDLSFIISHMENVSKDEFGENEILQDSMMFRLVQISENSRKLTEEYRALHGEIPWGDIFGLRNRIVHDYGQVDLTIVYETLVYDIPHVYRKLTVL